MTEYICPRCGYGTKIKTHMRKHLKRKKPCNAVLKNISILECLDALNSNNYKKVIKNPSFFPQKSLKNPSKIPQKSLNFTQNPSKIPQNPQNPSKITNL